MGVKRYFVGYPRPRLRPGPLLFAACWVVLAHPVTSELAAAMFVAVEKVGDDPVAVTVLAAPFERPPDPPPPGCRGMNHRAWLDDERVPLRRGTRVIPPDPSIVDRARAAGRERLRAAFEVCFDEDGWVYSVRRRRRSGEPEWDAALADAIRGWRYRSYWSWNHCRGSHRRPVCTIERFRFDP